MQDTSDVASMTHRRGKAQLPHEGKLIASRDALAWPQLTVSACDRGEHILDAPQASGRPGHRARIVLAAFRASAERYMQQWRREAEAALGGHAAGDLVEIAICDVQVRRPG